MDYNIEPKSLILDKIMALDLSFTSTGLAIVDFKNKQIYTRSIKVGCKNKSFVGMQESITAIIKIISEEVNKNNITKLVMEEPFPCTVFSSGLYGLDSSVYQHFKDIILKTYHPTTLKKIHGGKYTKKDSINLAETIITKLTNDGFNFINETSINKECNIDLFGEKLTKDKHYKITHDECEAFLYAIYTNTNYNCLFFK